MQTPGVETATGDQCQFGLQTRAGKGRMPARKRTRFMGNAGEILKELQKRCKGEHEHQHLIGGRAKEAGRYPRGLCQAICRGFIRQRQLRDQNVRALLSVNATDGVGEVPEHEDVGDKWDLAWDDVSGKELDAKEVRKARREEMEYIEKKGVWVKMKRSEALAQGYKIVDTRWIDIDKGDEQKPIYRSRLVGKEFNTGQEEGLFASTPPLEALRWLLSEAATRDQNGHFGRQVVLVSDVSRAFFEAPARRKVAVNLPEEALEEGETRDEIVGILRQSLYGTRDAAVKFSE